MWERVYRKVKGPRVEFVGVALKDTEAASREFVKTYGLTFPNGYDDGERVARAYAFVYQPYYVFINRDAKIASAFRGTLSEQELTARVQALTR
ncbi:MAG: TlpA family protein disulfide reductase [Armatimonadetes bacterium]|nr:TlpA family protein disulfide reductase [Armatimonadota bacterium]